MAISEACKYEIEENVDAACQEKGIPKVDAFRALQTFYNGIGVAITFSAVKSNYYRAKKEVANATPPPTPSNDTEITNNQTISENQTRPLAKDGTHRGGHREGAGRSIKHIPTKQEEKEKIISDDFQTAFELMLREIKNAKKLKWQTTSKEAAIKSVSVLYDVITI